MPVRLNLTLSELVATNVQQDGAYEKTVST